MPRGQVSDSDYQACVQILHDLRVVDLKTICRSLGIHLNGKKTELHQRIQTQLLKARHSSDNIKLYAFIKIISDVSQGIEPLSFQVIYSNFQQSDSYGMNSINSSTSQLNNHLYSSSIGSPVTFGHTHAMTGSSSTSAGVVNNQASVKPWLYFYESPFFKLKRLLTTDKSFSNPAFAYKCPDKRGETHIKFTLKDSEKELLSNSDKYRLYLLSGVYNNKSTSNKNHIAFPSPLELHLNNNEIKDNVKGIKGKEGTSKPADLTPYLKLDSSNHMKVVYAFAKTDYLIYLYIVEVTPISEIVKQVLDQPRISKTSSIHLLKESMGDEDLVQTLETIPLSCPLSLLRIETPCRSIKCKHLRCFDLFFFISMVKRTPNWVCPICNNEIKLSELAVDEYMVDILRNTTRDVISVELQEDGGWKPHEIDQEELDDDDLPNHNTTNNNNNNNNNSVAQDGTGANGNNITNNNTPSVNDHPSSSHEPIEIISLDSSDEEEEPPVADIANDTTPAPAVDPAPADTATTTTTHVTQETEQPQEIYENSDLEDQSLLDELQELDEGQQQEQQPPQQQQEQQQQQQDQQLESELQTPVTTDSLPPLPPPLSPPPNNSPIDTAQPVSETNHTGRGRVSFTSIMARSNINLNQSSSPSLNILKDSMGNQFVDNSFNGPRGRADDANAITNTEKNDSYDDDVPLIHVKRRKTQIRSPSNSPENSTNELPLASLPPPPPPPQSNISQTSEMEQEKQPSSVATNIQTANSDLNINLAQSETPNQVDQQPQPEKVTELVSTPAVGSVTEDIPAVITETDVNNSTSETAVNPLDTESLPESLNPKKDGNTPNDDTNKAAQVITTDTIQTTTAVPTVETPQVGGESTTEITESSGSSGTTELPSAATAATGATTAATATSTMTPAETMAATEATATPGNIISSNLTSTTKEDIPVTSGIVIIPPTITTEPVSEKSPSITTGNKPSTPSPNWIISTLKDIHNEIEKITNGIESPEAQIEKLKKAERLVDENIRTVGKNLLSLDQFKSESDIQFLLKLSPERLKHLLKTYNILRFKNEALRQRVKVNKGYSLSEIMNNPDYTLSNNSKELNSLMKEWLSQIVKNKEEIAQFEKENPEFLSLLKRLNSGSHSNSNPNGTQNQKTTPTASPQTISAQIAQNMLPNWNSSRLLSTKSIPATTQMANSKGPEADNRTANDLKRNSSFDVNLSGDLAKKQKTSPNNSGMFTNSPVSMRLSNYPQRRMDQVTMNNNTQLSNDSMNSNNISNSQSLNGNSGYPMQQLNSQSPPSNFNSPLNQQVPIINNYRGSDFSQAPHLKAAGENSNSPSGNSLNLAGGGYQQYPNNQQNRESLQYMPMSTQNYAAPMLPDQHQMQQYVQQQQQQIQNQQQQHLQQMQIIEWQQKLQQQQQRQQQKRQQQMQQQQMQQQQQQQHEQQQQQQQVQSPSLARPGLSQNKSNSSMSQEQHLQEFQYIDLRRQTDFLLRNSDEYKVFLEMQKQLYSLKSKSKIKSERLEFLKRASQSNGGPNEQELNEIKNISIQLVLSQQEIQNQQDLLSAQNKKLQLKSNSIIATLKKNMNSNATQEAVQNQPQSDNSVIQNDNSGVTQNDNSGVIDLTEDNE